MLNRHCTAHKSRSGGVGKYCKSQSGRANELQLIVRGVVAHLYFNKFFKYTIMAYKVTFNTYAIIGDNKIGNVVQSTEIIYTDMDIEKMKLAIDADLEKRNRVCEITGIDKVKGRCLF